MKKIIAAFDGLKYSAVTQAYATAVAKLSNSHLVGVFLDDKLYNSYNVYQLLVKKDVPEKKLQHYRQKDQHARDKAVDAFSKACDHARINYSVHRDHNPALQELVHETVFADMLVVDKKETLTHYDEDAPTRFICDLLANTHCPVLLVSGTYTPPDKIIVLYDGHPSSVYALKMFSYLFPFLKHLPVEVIVSKRMVDDSHVPDNKLMKEFVKRHLPDAVYKVFKGYPEDSMLTYLIQQSGKPLVVTGSYGRGIASRWLRPSLADTLMMGIDFPMFIAHHRK